MDTKSDWIVSYVQIKILERLEKYAVFEKNSLDENRGKMLFGKLSS